MAGGDAPAARRGALSGSYSPLIVVAAAAIIYLSGMLSPPYLMDDVDAVQAQIARHMLESGDWVTARLNGIKYLEKSPLIYWLMAVSFAVFGVHDWAARLPLALSVVALCGVAYRFGRWALGEAAGFYTGLTLATCVGLWLFTRIQIPDAMLTLTVTLALWGFLRALEPEEKRPGAWAAVMGAAMGTGLLLKGLIALVFPVGAGMLYLLVSRQLWSSEVWRRLHPWRTLGLIALIAAPWHVLATLRNPPYFDFTLKSEPGQYRGFFWFYFLNEHVFRFLNMRHPRDYNTVPRALFWGLHLLWLFPWSVFLPGAVQAGYRPQTRAGRARLLALCWIGVVLVFFTFSTTQEYYSMPCYPALALLLGDAVARGGRWVQWGRKALAAVAGMSVAVIVTILAQVWTLPAPGDISRALTQNPEAYTLSLGHAGDLTLASFAYLRGPLLLAGLAFLVGALGAWRLEGRRFALAAALMMILFFQAARLALIVFDPYMGSQPLAAALNAAPRGELIVDNQYYAFSSVFFYTNRRALLLNGRVNNLEYGSYEPGAPDVFLTDEQLPKLWSSAERKYLLVEGPQVERIARLVGRETLHCVAAAGGKYLFTNRPLEG